MNLITSLVRKMDSEMYQVKVMGNILMATGEHKVYTLEGYKTLSELPEKFSVLNIVGEYVDATKVQMDGVYPVLDFSVEKVHNYFSEGILSHNSPETTSGGKALPFYASVRNRVTRVEDIMQDKEVIGVKMKVANKKSKIGNPKREAELNVYFDSGIDARSEYADFAINFGVIEKSGSWYVTPDGERMQGKEKLYRSLREDDSLFATIKEAVEKHMFKINDDSEVEDDTPEPTEDGGEEE